MLDLYSRKIVGYALKATLSQVLVLTALDMALRRRQPAQGLLHHTDRGSQYAAGAYQQILDANGMVVSMSRKGNCWDNAVVESFFKTLKAEDPTGLCQSGRGDSCHPRLSALLQ